MKRLLEMGCVALVAGVVVAPAGALTSEEGWQIVPEQALAELRGGIDLPKNNLVAYFAIQRVLAVDGQVVASMQIVISHLDSGGPPTISIAGANPALVQIMNALPVSAPTLSPTAAAPAAAAAAPVATAAPAVAATSSGPTSTTVPAGNGGSVSTSNTQTGSSAQFGSALANAVAAATGAPGGAGGAGEAAAPSTPAAAPAANPGAPASFTKVIPLATGGQIVISNLPNASAITTAVQNEVQGAALQVQTTINASMNSLTALNAVSLGNAIRAQVIATAH